MGGNDDGKTPMRCALEIVEKRPRSTRGERLTRLLDAGELAANEQPEARVLRRSGTVYCHKATAFSMHR